MAGEQQRGEEEVDELELLTRPGREDDLRTFLLLLHPADVAELLGNASEATALAILRHLEPERAANLLSELEPHEQERILAQIRPEELGPIVGEMETDDAADLLQELDERTVSQVLATMPLEERQEVAQLLRYDPESAGGIMQTELVAVPETDTVAQAIDRVREAADEVDLIGVFVVDAARRYSGHLSLQDLVLSKPDTPVSRIMTPKVVEVTPEVDQEAVARIFDRYSLVELGVVDPEGRLLGRITADDVHEVLVEEAEEDMLKMAGTVASPEAIYSGDVLRVVAQRLPWLASTFCAGLVATWILQQAQVVFATKVMLLTFVPVITGMSGNVGTQSAMIMIRGMAMGHVASDSLAKDILKDVTVSGIMAAASGIVVAVVVGIWHAEPLLGVCVGIALFVSMTAASVLGSTEPALLERFGVDPAVAAGPMITSINDITGVTIYALVCAAFLGRLG